MKIIEEIGECALLENLAEEACEMGQAALKLSRVKRGENPTPKAEWEAEAELIEEIADCYTVLDELLRDKDWLPGILNTMDRKKARWERRLEQKRDIDPLGYTE